MQSWQKMDRRVLSAAGIRESGPGWFCAQRSRLKAIKKEAKMLRYVNNPRFGCGLWVLVLLSSAAAAQTSGSTGGPNVDWPTYAGNWDASKYKPLDQINASNFSKLEIVWRFKTDHIGNRPEFKLEGTPL